MDMVVHALLFLLLGLSTTNAQFSMSNYGSMDQLTRIPGYHPAIAYPGSRTPDLSQQSRDSDSYTRTSSDTCPEVNRDCPRDCRRLDERNCRVCRCHGNIDIKTDPLVHSQSSAPTRCFPMVMCMMTCKRGYRLSDVTDKHGCQACTCLNEQREGTHSTESLDKIIAALLEETGKHSSIDKHEQSLHGGDGNWEGGFSGMVSFKGDGGSTGTDNHAVGSGNEHGSTSSSGCSGPMCPQNTGMNPMHPGVDATESASSNTDSCTGPFCLGQGGGMGGSGGGAMGGMMMTGGGSSGSCNGPFCISGGMMGGSGGGMMGGAGGGVMGGAGGGMMGGAGGGVMGGAGGGMMGGAGGGMMGGAGGSTMGGAGGGMMGGAGGGMMGGAGSGMMSGAGGGEIGGTGNGIKGGDGMSGSGGIGSGAGGFSPFGMSASGGASSGCTGPFCTMASMGNPGSATSSTSNSGTYGH